MLRPPRSWMRLAALLLALPLLGAGSCVGTSAHIGLPTLSGVLPIEIPLSPSIDPAAVTVALDGADVTGAFAPGGPGLVGSIRVPPPGPHRLTVTRPWALPVGSLSSGVLFDSPSAAPAVLALAPPAQGGLVASGAWLRFLLAAPADASALAGFGFAIECDGARVARTAHPQGDGALILNPTPALPPGASCRVTWRDETGAVAEIAFAVAADAAGAPAIALYERESPLSIAPFPDDYWTEADATKPTGLRVALPAPPFPEPTQNQAFVALAGMADDGDGWSRQTPIVIALSHPLDPSQVPADPFAAQDPFTPIALVDVDPASPDFGERVPYRLLVRTDPRPGGGFDHAAILFPTIDLREQGRYAVVFTRRAFAAGEPGRGYGPSPLFAAALAEPSDGEPAEAARVRSALAGALEAVEALGDAPIPREDIALALSVSIRTHPAVDDLVQVKELTLAGPPPQLVLPDIATDPCPAPGSFCIRVIANRALEVRGRVRLPRYRNAMGLFNRDPATGAVTPTGFDEAPFVMSLPRAALTEPVFPVMYQHGNPGTPSELLGAGSEQIDDAGFALLGFQDTLNRELGQDVSLQVQVIFFFLLQLQAMPDYWMATGADQISFLRAIQGLGGLDLMRAGPTGEPEIGPDGRPEIDPSTILYKGISEGANNAQRFLPFAPEILAAEATVGGARLGETLIHQSADQILQQIGAFLPQLRPIELWVGLSLFQAGFDPQDGHTFLRHLYREPLLPFAGSSDVTPPSTIWTEGIGDSLVPNNATRAMALELGIPHVRPIARALPTLEQVDPPLAGNIAPGITAGYFQFDPFTTPDCIARAQFEGHYCPQSGAEAKAQRLHFLLSALAGEAEIVDPF